MRHLGPASILVALTVLLTPLQSAIAQDSVEVKYDRFGDSTSITVSRDFILTNPEHVSLGLSPRSVSLTVGVHHRGKSANGHTLKAFVSLLSQSTVSDSTLKVFDDAESIQFLLDRKRRFSARRAFYQPVFLAAIDRLVELAQFSLTAEQLRALAGATEVEARIGNSDEIAAAPELAALARGVLKAVR